LDAKNCIETGEDQSNACHIFYEYFKRVKDYIDVKCEDTIRLSNTDKKGIFDYIYDYAMLEIYRYIFPAFPSKSDRELAKHINTLKGATPEELQIKPSNRHEELWDLSIKSKFN